MGGGGWKHSCQVAGGAALRWPAGEILEGNCWGELVEINRIIDVMNKTAILSVGLVRSALGKKIL
jgi:hypothetical protein